jgi:photosystem II stability/assembly factor-like uncharacterized protein
MKIITTIISIFWLLITIPLSAANFNLDTGYAASADKYDKTLINEVDMAGSRIIGVGIHGVIIYSDDQGKNWKQSIVPTTKTLTAIDCLNERLCWAVGHDAYILKTSNGGESWDIQYSDEIFDAPLLSISMFNNRVGIAVGAFAKSLRTNDGGTTWEEFFVTEDEFQPHLNNVSTNGMNAYVAGELGLFYHSSDQGLNWTTYETGYNGSLWSSLLIKDDQLILIGMSGNIILATLADDIGFQFEIYNNGIQNTLTSATNLSDGRIAIAGLGGVVSVVDFIQNRDISTCVRQDRLGNNAILETTDNDFLIIGQKGSRFHDMNECQTSSLQANATNTWLVTNIN